MGTRACGRQGRDFRTERGLGGSPLGELVGFIRGAAALTGKHPFSTPKCNPVGTTKPLSQKLLYCVQCEQWRLPSLSLILLGPKPDFSRALSI